MKKEHVRYFDWTPMVKEMIQDTDDIHIKAQKAINTIIDMAIEQVHTLNKEYLSIRLVVVVFKICSYCKEFIKSL